MYRPNDARFGFARWWYWCGSRLWRGRIKIVSVGAQAGLVISRLVRLFLAQYDLRLCAVVRCYEYLLQRSDYFETEKTVGCIANTNFNLFICNFCISSFLW